MEEAVIKGTYSDFKIIKTRSCAQMIIEVPIEYAEKVVKCFGLPNPAKEINVAVARIQEEYVKDQVKPKSYAGEAKLLFKEYEFFLYLREKFKTSMIDDVEEYAKNILCINSCSELIEGEPCTERFKRLRGDYHKAKKAAQQHEAYRRG